MINNKQLNDYLHFGYIPEFGDVTRINEILKPVNSGAYKRKELANLDERALVKKGIEVINSVFDDLVKKAGSERKHLVPLSGGLDSRLILAALIDRVEAKNIEAITFGSPYSFDYEIPARIVKESKVDLERINCTKLEYSFDNLKGAIKNGGRWTSLPDIYINQKALKLNQEYCRWSGFLGGELAGSYGDLNSDLGDNQEIFVKYQQKSKSIKLPEENYSPVESLNPIENNSIGNLTEFEQLFLYNRSASGAFSIMFPDNTTINDPFLHPYWVNFILNVPNKFRRKSLLFHKILLEMYPNQMNLPTKNRAGLGLGNTSKVDYYYNLSKLKVRFEVNKLIQNIHFPPIGVNYLDYKNSIKKLSSLHNSIKNACENLEDQKIIPWLSPKEIFQNHLNGKTDHSAALLLLLGLELNLQVSESEIKTKN